MVGGKYILVKMGNPIWIHRCLIRCWFWRKYRMDFVCWGKSAAIHQNKKKKNAQVCFRSSPRYLRLNLTLQPTWTNPKKRMFYGIDIEKRPSVNMNQKYALPSGDISLKQTGSCTLIVLSSLWLQSRASPEQRLQPSDTTPESLRSAAETRFLSTRQEALFNWKNDRLRLVFQQF